MDATRASSAADSTGWGQQTRPRACTCVRRQGGTYDSAPEEAGPGHGGLRDGGKEKQDFLCSVPIVSASLIFGGDLPGLTLLDLGRGLPCFGLEQAHADGAVVRHVRVVNAGSLRRGPCRRQLTADTGARGRESDSQT